jgi:hypothetical protein
MRARIGDWVIAKAYRLMGKAELLDDRILGLDYHARQRAYLKRDEQPTLRDGAPVRRISIKR